MEEHSLVSRVKALAEAMEGSAVSELDLTEDGLRVVVRRQVEPTVALVPTSKTIVARSGPAPRRHQESRPSSQAPAPVGIAVVAPLTGVFYMSPSPSSPPFVEVGDTVQAGQVVCIVEAMKVFNEIKSEISGTVAAIVAPNGQLVQKGEALIRVQAI